MKHLDLELVDALADCQAMIDNDSPTEAIQEFMNFVLKFWPESDVWQYLELLDYPDVAKFIH